MVPLPSLPFPHPQRQSLWLFWYLSLNKMLITPLKIFGFGIIYWLLTMEDENIAYFLSKVATCNSWYLPLCPVLSLWFLVFQRLLPFLCTSIPELNHPSFSPVNIEIKLTQLPERVFKNENVNSEIPLIGRDFFLNIGFSNCPWQNQDSSLLPLSLMGLVMYSPRLSHLLRYNEPYLGKKELMKHCWRIQVNIYPKLKTWLCVSR